MLTNTQIQAFAESLSAVGVIKTGKKKALSAIQPEKGKAAAYATHLENAFKRIQELDHKARERGYREAEIKVIRSAVDVFITFAKKNVENLQNRNITALNAQLDQIENAYTMIPYNEGDTVMNIRENAQKIIDIYKSGADSLSSNDRAEIALIQKAQDYIREIAAAIDNVADGSSENAAKLQKQIFDSLAAWAAEYANEHFPESALRELEKAVTAAKTWATLKAPAAVTTGGIFGLFAKKGAVKLAEEGSFLTYEKAMENDNHRRMLVLAKYPEAKEKVEAISSLIEKTRQNADETGLREMEQTYEMLKEEKDEKTEV